MNTDKIEIIMDFLFFDLPRLVMTVLLFIPLLLFGLSVVYFYILKDVYFFLNDLPDSFSLPFYLGVTPCLKE